MTDRITIRTPDDLGAAIPYLIGYVPDAGDLIVVTFRPDRSLGFCAHIPPWVDMAQITDLPDICHRNGMTHAAVVAWDADDADAESAAAGLGLILENGGVEVLHAAPYRPGTDVSPVVAGLVTKGAAPVASRDVMESEFAPTGNGWSDDVAARVTDLVVVSHRDTVLRLLAEAGNGALRDSAASLTRALADRPLDAEPGRVANLAGVVAVVWYLLGDGGRANIAVDVGRAADPDNNLCALLEGAFRMGLQPTDLRTLLAATA